MAWIAMDCDNTLIDKKTGVATPGAPEAMQHLLDQGHRVSIWTARFSHAKDSRESRRIRENLENELETNEIPYSDIWVGHVKPDVDVFVGDNLVPYAGDWAQSLSMLKMFLGKASDGNHESSEEE
jgi:FMN phosphatase YigB (HAD superfamily)